MVRGHRVIGSPGYPLDEAWLREVGRRMFARGGIDRGAARRQGAAILAGPATADPTSPASGFRRSCCTEKTTPSSGLTVAGLWPPPSPKPSW
jgi:hypothetical protein